MFRPNENVVGTGILFTSVRSGSCPIYPYGVNQNKFSPCA